MSEDRCHYCGGPGPGRYGEMIMVPMLPEVGHEGVRHHTIFVCQACVDQACAEAAAHEELMKDPEYAATYSQIEADHAREFHQALENNGIKIQ